jgi:diguanylate cyclase (GGDEF)-like protein/PAS domain S-box-containing protein
MKMHALPSQEHSKGEILIVEDTPASLKLLSDLLTEAGYYVRQAPNGELALWTAASRPPELILLDVRMPGIDGFEVCRSLKQSEALRDIPVIFLSAQYDTDDKVRGFGLGAVDFIAKPFQAEEILARTDTHVRLARAQRQLAQERAGLEARVRERTAQLAAAASRVQEELRQRRANEESLRLAGQVFDATLDAIFVTDARGRLLIVNPAFTRLTGYTQAEVIGKGPSLVRADAADATYRQMLRDVVAHGHWSGEIMGRHKDGASHPGMLSVSAARDADGVLRNYVAVFMDISERKAERRLIDFLQWHDALTGLPNRALARERFDACVAGCAEGTQVAVLCLDLDRFKSVNDALGHQFGDRALQAVANFLCAQVRDDDTVTRQGGDEFQLILCDDAGLEQTAATARRILAGLREALYVDGQHLPLTTSIGIAVYPSDGSSLDELVRNADTALVRAKQTGRDGYSYFTERMNEDIRQRMAIEQQLRGAIARAEFTVHYQPQMCLSTGHLLGAEALLRWDNALLGSVGPDRFIPLAEEVGLIREIGAWVLESVAAQIAAWRALGHDDIKVAVNLSGRQFEEEGTVDFVEQVLRRHALPAACLGLEITEGTVMGVPDKAVATLSRLKAIGVTISLDDFGTGYSSLGYLKRFPIGTLKIDKSFIDDVTTSAADAAIALSVISLGHNLGMKVVAEGVETRAQRDFLREHGCDEMQGYFFSRPLPAAAMTALLATRTNLYAADAGASTNARGAG